MTKHKTYNKKYRLKRIQEGYCGCCWSRKAKKNRVTCTICLDKRHRNSVLLKSEVIKEYGGICTCCGETILAFLTIDHVKGSGGKERKLVGSGFSFYRSLKRRGYPKDGYQVLCFNCNCGKRINNGVCPHKERKNERPYRTDGRPIQTAEDDVRQ